MNFKQRFQTKLSKAIELSGEEKPISKEVKQSQIHDSGLASFRASAYSILESASLRSSLGADFAPKMSLTPTVFPPFPGQFFSSPHYPPASGPSLRYQSPLPTPPNPPLYTQSYYPTFATPSPAQSSYQWPQSGYPSHNNTPVPTYSPPASVLPRYSSLPPTFPTPSSGFKQRPTQEIPAQLVASCSTDNFQVMKGRSPIKPAGSGKSEFKAKVKEARKRVEEKKVVKEVEIPFSTKREVNYQPYTYEDYLKVKQEGNARLGGLGPANINTKEWKDQTRRRIQASLYGKMTRLRNREDPQFQTYD